MLMKPAFVYIVECADGSYYTGWTFDIAKRLKAHNGEILGGAKYTRTRRPVILKWHFECESKNMAQSFEMRIKHLTRKEKDDLITNGSFIEEWRTMVKTSKEKN